MSIQKIDNITKELNELKEKIQILEKELSTIKEPSFNHVPLDNFYYCFCADDTGLYIDRRKENYSYDEHFFNSNNYFHTEERAMEILKKINFMLKLECYKDTFCPDYEPDWSSYDEDKYGISYDTEIKKFKVNSSTIFCHHVKTYFPSYAIAQQVCDKLNNEIANE